jgi:hypothetical protein
MARKKMSVEGMLVGHFAVIDLAEAKRLLSLARGIVEAREAADEPVKREREPRRPRASTSKSESASE